VRRSPSFNSLGSGKKIHFENNVSAHQTNGICDTVGTNMTESARLTTFEISEENVWASLWIGGTKTRYTKHTGARFRLGFTEYKVHITFALQDS
jgi:hypothetical protein